MKIRNLSYLKHVTESSAVVGGNVYARTDTITRTGFGYAVADGVALAEGQFTTTDAQTLTRVRYYGNFTVSMADARGRASAITGSKIARFSSFSTSTSLTFTSSNN
ncbi:MAG: TonB-dependent receptor [Komarekiella atlantica HA4396-MV6]|nr:TonB-dependent receptor [Komarekiella atlantica HA4396-MV6]